MKILTFDRYPIAYVEFTTNDDKLKNLMLSLYFMGCDKKPKCRGCHNPHLWTQRGPWIDGEQLEYWLFGEPMQLAAGIILMGGEPLAIHNRKFAKEIIKSFKEYYKQKRRVVVYTWREEEETKEILKDVFDLVDAFKFGPWIQELATNGIPASRNQRWKENESARYYIAKPEFIYKL